MLAIVWCASCVYLFFSESLQYYLSSLHFKLNTSSSQISRFSVSELCVSFSLRFLNLSAFIWLELCTHHTIACFIDLNILT
jgi:hypothetical protein